MKDEGRPRPLRDAGQDFAAARAVPDSPQSRSPAYRLAYADLDFLLRDELRPVRLQLELLKPELIMAERGIRSTVVVLGGSRVPAPGGPAERAGQGAEGGTGAGAGDRAGVAPARADLARYYEEARRFAAGVTARSLAGGGGEWVVVTGGGPGIMEAGNRGAREAGGISIGLNIVLPREQAPNPYVTPELCFNFHYFAIRKMHFLLRARAIAVFPGGFGTLDELFEALTLIQTQRMRPVPLLLFGRAFWTRMVDWQGLEAAGLIDPGDLGLLRFVETAEEALAVLDAAAGPGGAELHPDRPERGPPALGHGDAAAGGGRG